MRLPLFALMFALAAGSADAADRCGFLVSGADGEISLSLADSFDPEDLTRPLTKPENAIAVQCARERITPRLHDDRVLVELSLTINLQAGDRIGVLEVSDGRFRYRLIKGDLRGGAESKEIGDRLDLFQARVQGEQPATP